MKRFVGIAIVFSGMTFSFFLINIILYMYNPVYHNLLQDAVYGKSDIPVVDTSGREIDTGMEIVTGRDAAVDEAVEDVSLKTAEDVSLKTSDDEMITATISEDREEIPLASLSENTEQPVIISKEYHEDCGSGKGYWVITYEDGSVGVE